MSENSSNIPINRNGLVSISEMVRASKLKANKTTIDHQE
jgi:hypothetical protein